MFPILLTSVEDPEESHPFTLSLQLARTVPIATCGAGLTKSRWAEIINGFSSSRTELLEAGRKTTR